MSTLRQTEANQANALKSTGPKTETGKAASSTNRLSHGFFSKSCIVPGEKAEDFEALVADLTLEHQPATLTERVFVEQMAVSYWLSKRAVRLQSHVFVTQCNLPGDERFGPPKELSLLIRYKTTADNNFIKAHNQLLKIQKERKKSEIGFEPQTASRAPEKEPETPPAPNVETEIPEQYKDLVAIITKEEPQILPQILELFKNAA